MATIISIIVESTLYARRRGVGLGRVLETVEHARFQRRGSTARKCTSAVTIEIQGQLP
jgi:hypothetical protein